MSKAKTATPEKTELKKIPSPKDNVSPLFVAAKDVERIIIGFNKKTAANWRSMKKGPRYHMVSGTPYYKVSDLVDYFGKNPVETFNNDKENYQY
jgi:hypothetical protein